MWSGSWAWVGRWGGAGEEAQMWSRCPPDLLGQGSATRVLRGGPMSLFTLHLNQTTSSFLHVSSDLGSQWPEGISQQGTAALGTGRMAPHSSIPHHCHIIATCGLCDLGQITAPLWAFAPPFQAPLLRVPSASIP